MASFEFSSSEKKFQLFLLLVGLVACPALAKKKLPEVVNQGYQNQQSQKGNFSVVAPQKFRPGSVYKFAVTIYGPEKSDYFLTAGIVGSSGQVLVERKFNVNQKPLTKVAELNIPEEVPEGSFQFVAQAKGTVEFNISHDIELIRKVQSLYIQTDKSLYKPGQTVLFRVIAIDPNLKPLNLPINVSIYDQANNRILQLFNQSNVSGVINNQLKLSDITPLGQWKIEAQTEKAKKEVYFQVAEYVLPKFEVKVILPSYYFINLNNPSIQEDLLITTTATYTFGKPVKGFATIRIQIADEWMRWRFTENSAPYIEKRVELVDGKADISLTLKELNGLDPDGSLKTYYSLFVQSNVTEAATGTVLQGNSTVPIKSQRYQITFLPISADNFMPGFNYRAYIRLSQVDDSNPLLSDITEANGKFKSLFVRTFSNENVVNSSIQLTSSGYVTFETTTGTNWSSINIQVSFNDTKAGSEVQTSKYISAFETRDAKYIQLSVVGETSVIKPNTKLELKVKSTEKIKEFQYQVIGKSGILVSGCQTLKVASKESTFNVQFDPAMTLAAAPEVRLVVFYVTSTGELVADSLALSVTDYYSNKVSIAFAPTSVAPGDAVKLEVKVNPGSYVSLLAVDQSVLLLAAGNDITKQMVSDDLQGYSSSSSVSPRDGIFFGFRPIWIGGSDTGSLLNNAGLFVETSFFIQYQRFIPWLFFNKFEIAFEDTSDMMARPAVQNNPVNPPDEPAPSVQPRKNFPETFIWSDVVAGSNGSMTLQYTVPDTITSWIASAFATHISDGLGIADDKAKVTVIKPFFISLNLPYSIIREEQFALQATVFNYFGQDLKVNVTLPKSNYYQVKICVDGKETMVNDSISKIVSVPNNDMVTVYFWLVATSLGQIPIEVRALAGVAADSLIVNLLVKPEGRRQSYSSSSLLRLEAGETKEADFVVSLPPPDLLVSDSVIVEATLVGDVLGSALNNLDELLQMPYGCGEQNMITLAPDVYIVNYLSATNRLTPDIKSKALGFINEGYQRELTYQRTDGSFSAFGNNDQAGSVWLSSFVLRVFEDADDYVPIDSSKTFQTYLWILTNQDSEGAFKEPPEGRVIHTDMQGGSASGIALTAYVAITLLKCDNPNLSTVKDKAKLTVAYLEKNYKDYSSDPYVLSIIGYAFFLADSAELSNVLSILDSLATNEGGMTYWHRETAGAVVDPGVWMPPYERPQSRDVEMTSYVLLIYSSKKDLSKAIPIARWLVKNRNAQGGFSSTQDTVLGLEALAEFGRLVVPTETSSLSVKVSQDATAEVYEFKKITRETSLLFQSTQLPSGVKNVKFTAKGEGLGLVQVNVQYNIKSQQLSRLIIQNLSTKTNDTKLTLEICLSWLGVEKTGMVLTEINLLTGYVLSDGYEDALKRDLNDTFKKQEYRNNILAVYLDELTSKQLCFNVNMESAFLVSNVKPGLVKTYQYYSPDVATTDYYSTKSTSGSFNVCDAATKK